MQLSPSVGLGKIVYCLRFRARLKFASGGGVSLCMLCCAGGGSAAIDETEIEDFGTAACDD